jgi:hypothetical protein
MLSSSAKSSTRLPRKWTVAEDLKLKEEVEAQSMLFHPPTIAVAIRIGARTAQGQQLNAHLPRSKRHLSRIVCRHLLIQHNRT